MTLDPEIKRKAEDLKGHQTDDAASDADPEQTPANQERAHLDEKVEDIVDRAAATAKAAPRSTDR